MSKSLPPEETHPAIKIAVEAIELLNAVLEENKRLRLAIGIMQHRRKPGRPKSKQKINTAEKKPKGRPKIDYSDFPEGFKKLKKKYGVTTDQEAFDCFINDIKKRDGRDKASKHMKKKKGILNALARERNKMSDNPK